MKFYKRDPDRALAGMSELTLKQRGAYNSIIDLLYSRDGDVPDDDLRVAKMISCHWREWKAVKEELIAVGKIWVEGGRITARRVQETLKEAADFSQDQSRRASQRWQKSKKTNENNHAAMPPGNALTPTPTPREEKEVDKSTSQKTGSRIPDDFQPDARAWSLAEELHYDNRESQQAFDNFLDYWRSVPGARGRKLDWQATFRNWLRNNRNRKPNNGKAPGTSRSDAFAVLDAVVDEARRRETGGGEPDDETTAGELPGLWEDHAGLRRRHN